MEIRDSDALTRDDNSEKYTGKVNIRAQTDGEHNVVFLRFSAPSSQWSIESLWLVYNSTQAGYGCWSLLVDFPLPCARGNSRLHASSALPIAETARHSWAESFYIAFYCFPPHSRIPHPLPPRTSQLDHGLSLNRAISAARRCSIHQALAGSRRCIATVLDPGSGFFRCLCL